MMTRKWHRKTGLVILFNNKKVYPPKEGPYCQNGIIIILSVIVTYICDCLFDLGIFDTIFIYTLTGILLYCISCILIIAYYRLKWHRRENT